MKNFIFIFIFIFTYAQPLSLTSEEKKLLEQHPVKCISTGLWAPFNLLENGKLVGIGFDYWNLIRKKLGIKNGCKKAKKWTQVLTEIKEKKSDMTIASAPTPERLKYAIFSKPYVTYPIVIATKNDVGFIHDINLIKDKTIAIGKGYAVANILKQYYPELKVKYVESIDEALRLVSESKVFATLEIFPVIAYKLNKNKFYNLKISGSIPHDFPVSIMLRKDYTWLIPLINKAIDTINKEEENTINERWVKLHHIKKVSSKYFYILLIGAFITVLFFSIWLFVLQKKIINKDEKEKELKKLVSIDSLTSIFNRYMLDVTLDKEIALAKRYHTPLSIVFFDINGFKTINDVCGHKKGDYVLKELSTFVSKSVRQSDIFGRWGGDEFLIILVNTTKEDAIIFAKNIDSKIKQYDFKDSLNVSCTFGVTSYQDGDNRETIIKRADEQFYKEKNLK